MNCLIDCTSSIARRVRISWVIYGSDERPRVGERLACIGLTKPFLDFRQEAEPFNGSLKLGGIRKPLYNLKDFLFHRFSGHRDHLFRFVR